MTPAAITITAAALLLYASASNARANVEAGQGGASFDLGNLTDSIESTMNQITEQAAQVSIDTAGRNIAAFLAMLQTAEGTSAAADPYRVCYGYSHTIADMSDHPVVTGEWPGQRLPDAMCKNAGFGPGCVSTAAGAYQIIRPTWIRIRDSLGLLDFGPAAQDAAAAIARGLDAAIAKCAKEWASLPGNYAAQGQRSHESLIAWFNQNGGLTA